jgi:DNA polymerase-3 subunit epsilon
VTSGPAAGRPACLERTVGTPAYGVFVITPAAAAEPAEAAAGDRPLAATDFVIVDLETTGWDPEQARIIEIGAVRVSAGQLRDRFSSLVNPDAAIPARIAELTGISDQTVALAPPLRQVLPAFLAFARDAALTAHNAPFDVGFLRAGCRSVGLAWPDFPVVDTAQLARRLLTAGEVPDCKLSTLAVFFGVRTQPTHRALDDALATGDVLLGLLPRLAGTGVTSLGELTGFLRRPARRSWLARLWSLLAPRSGPGHAARTGGRAVRYRRWLGIRGQGGRRGHRDRSGPSRRGAHPGDGDDDSPDPAGQ